MSTTDNGGAQHDNFLQDEAIDNKNIILMVSKLFLGIMGVFGTSRRSCDAESRVSLAFAENMVLK